jgi:hypothetical protein
MPDAAWSAGFRTNQLPHLICLIIAQCLHRIRLRMDDLPHPDMQKHGASLRSPRVSIPWQPDNPKAAIGAAYSLTEPA